MIEDELAEIERWIILLHRKLDVLIEHLMPKPKEENKELKQQQDKALEGKGQTNPTVEEATKIMKSTYVVR